MSTLTDRASGLARQIIIATAVLMVLTAQPAYPQARPDAREIMKNVSNTYQLANSYHVEGTLFVEWGFPDNHVFTLELPMVKDGARPGKSREEITHPDFASLAVSDGVTKWSYSNATKEYTKKSVESSNATFALSAQYDKKVKQKSMDLDIGTDSGNMIAAYENLGAKVKTARLIREEAAMIRGRRAECYVLELDWQSPPKTFSVRILPKTILWIEKATNLVVRDRVTTTMQIEGQDVTLTYDEHYDLIRVNGPVTDAMFVFTPPLGASEVKEFKTKP